MFFTPFISAAIGSVPIPDFLANGLGTVSTGGLGVLINLVLRVMLVGAGVYAVFNFILAGYSFMSAGGDPGKVANAWSKIYQTAIGLVVAAGALVLAAIFGRLIFNDWLFLLNPELPTP